MAVVLKVLCVALDKNFTAAGIALFDDKPEIKRPPKRERCMRQAPSLIDRSTPFCVWSGFQKLFEKTRRQFGLV